MTELALQRVPTQADLERLYFELAQVGAPSVGRKTRWPYRPQTTEALLALAGAMLRYDARLLSILLQFVTQQEAELNPRRLRSYMSKMRYPQTLLVVFEFAKTASPEPEVRFMAEYLGKGFSPVSPAERFFVDSDRPGSRRATSRIGRNLRAYSKWGFVGTERPTFDTFRKQSVGTYDAQTRRQIALGLVRRYGAVSLARYLNAVDGSVSRAQARADLRAAGLELSGRGRGATWSLP